MKSTKTKLIGLSAAALLALTATGVKNSVVKADVAPTTGTNVTDQDAKTKAQAKVDADKADVEKKQQVVNDAQKAVNDSESAETKAANTAVNDAQDKVNKSQQAVDTAKQNLDKLSNTNHEDEQSNFHLYFMKHDADLSGLSTANDEQAQKIIDSNKVAPNSADYTALKDIFTNGYNFQNKPNEKLFDQIAANTAMYVRYEMEKLQNSDSKIDQTPISLKGTTSFTPEVQHHLAQFYLGIVNDVRKQLGQSPLKLDARATKVAEDYQKAVDDRSGNTYNQEVFLNGHGLKTYEKTPADENPLDLYQNYGNADGYQSYSGEQNGNISFGMTEDKTNQWKKLNGLGEVFNSHGTLGDLKSAIYQNLFEDFTGLVVAPDKTTKDYLESSKMGHDKDIHRLLGLAIQPKPNEKIGKLSNDNLENANLFGYYGISKNEEEANSFPYRFTYAVIADPDSVHNQETFNNLDPSFVEKTKAEKDLKDAQDQLSKDKAALDQAKEKLAQAQAKDSKDAKAKQDALDKAKDDLAKAQDQLKKDQEALDKLIPSTPSTDDKGKGDQTNPSKDDDKGGKDSQTTPSKDDNKGKDDQKTPEDGKDQPSNPSTDTPSTGTDDNQPSTTTTPSTDTSSSNTSTEPSVDPSTSTDASASQTTNNAEPEVSADNSAVVDAAVNGKVTSPVTTTAKATSHASTSNRMAPVTMTRKQYRESLP